MKPEINRPKALLILSLLSAIASGYYFLSENLPEAIAFTALASILDSAGLGAETNKQKSWAPSVKNALDRSADAATFVGFALSGLVSKTAGGAALVLVIILPYWIKKLWRINIRRFFHAGLIAWSIYFLVR